MRRRSCCGGRSSSALRFYFEWGATHRRTDRRLSSTSQDTGFSALTRINNQVSDTRMSSLSIHSRTLSLWIKYYFLDFNLNPRPRDYLFEHSTAFVWRQGIWQTLPTWTWVGYQEIEAPHRNEKLTKLLFFLETQQHNHGCPTTASSSPLRGPQHQYHLWDG